MASARHALQNPGAVERSRRDFLPLPDILERAIDHFSDPKVAVVQDIDVPAMGDPDAARRETILGKYRAGSTTSTELAWETYSRRLALSIAT